MVLLGIIGFLGSKCWLLKSKCVQVLVVRSKFVKIGLLSQNFSFMVNNWFLRVNILVIEVKICPNFGYWGQNLSKFWLLSQNLSKFWLLRSKFVIILVIWSIIGFLVKFFATKVKIWFLKVKMCRNFGSEVKFLVLW